MVGNIALAISIFLPRWASAYFMSRLFNRVRTAELRAKPAVQGSVWEMVGLHTSVYDLQEACDGLERCKTLRGEMHGCLHYNRGSWQERINKSGMTCRESSVALTVVMKPVSPACFQTSSKEVLSFWLGFHRSEPKAYISLIFLGQVL
jgi:hypothetical protein